MLYRVRRNVHVIVVCEELEQAGTIVRVVVRTSKRRCGSEASPPGWTVGSAGVSIFIATPMTRV